jgi:hypothetical protein
MTVFCPLNRNADVPPAGKSLRLAPFFVSLLLSRRSFSPLRVNQKRLFSLEIGAVLLELGDGAHVGSARRGDAGQFRQIGLGLAAAGVVAVNDAEAVAAAQA